jgi:hypothetical protein
MVSAWRREGGFGLGFSGQIWTFRARSSMVVGWSG